MSEPNDPPRLLVVDDEMDILIVVKTVLKARAGFEVHTCARSEDAVEMAAELKPAAVLLDFMMPGLNGEETLAALRADARTADVPVIFMTARGGIPDSLLNQPGVLGLITKPFDQRTIAQDVRTLLGPDEGADPPSSAAQPDVGALLDKYRVELPGKVATIESYWGKVIGSSDEGALKEMTALTHRLAGSGATFGFPAVGRAAAALEAALEEGRAGATERSRIEGLLADLKRAAS